MSERSDDSSAEVPVADPLARAHRELEPTRGDLERRRAEVAQRLDDLRLAVRSDLGWVPRSRTWLVPLVAAAGGVAVALAMRRRRRRRPRLDSRR